MAAIIRACTCVAACPHGRFGVNCAKECHCEDTGEQCDSESGRCASGCHHLWTGDSCQGMWEVLLCLDCGVLVQYVG